MGPARHEPQAVIHNEPRGMAPGFTHTV